MKYNHKEYKAFDENDSCIENEYPFFEIVLGVAS